jgi:hypothetical protein
MALAREDITDFMQTKEIARTVYDDRKNLAQASGKGVLVSIGKASKFLGCAPSTLREWDNSGIFPAVRMGKRGDRKYWMHELEELLRIKRDER